MPWIQHGDLPFLLGFAGIVVVITASVALLVGRRLAKRSKALAVVVCTAVSPALFMVLALVASQGGRRVSVASAAPAYAFTALSMLAALSLPIAGLTSAVLILRKRRLPA